MLLYVDEKGPITARTWRYILVIDTGKGRKGSKINGLLNVFGAYDHTNDKIHVHCYRNKTGKQFVDSKKSE